MTVLNKSSQLVAILANVIRPFQEFKIPVAPLYLKIWTQSAFFFQRVATEIGGQMMKDAWLVPRSFPFFSHDRFALKVVFSNQLNLTQINSDSTHPILSTSHRRRTCRRNNEILHFLFLESFSLLCSLAFFFLFNFLAYCFSSCSDLCFFDHQKNL